MNKNLKLAALFVALISVSFFVACKKDIARNSDNVNELQVEKEAFSLSKFEHLQNYESYMPEKEEIGSLINQFKMVVEQNKVGQIPTQMPLSEAVWNVEALLNAKRGHAGCKLPRIHKDFSSSVKLENGTEGVEMSLIEMTKQYYLLLEKVQQALDVEPATTKEIVFADVRVIKNNKKELELGLHVVIGVDPQGPFYAWMPPTCQQLTRTETFRINNSCSVHNTPWETIRVASSNILFGHCTPNFLVPNMSSIPRWDVNTGYFTGIVAVEPVFPSSNISSNSHYAINDVSLADPFKKYFLYYYQPNGGHCISTTNMRFYRNGVITVLSRYFENPPATVNIGTKSLVDIQIWPSSVPGTFSEDQLGIEPYVGDVVIVSNN